MREGFVSQDAQQAVFPRFHWCNSIFALRTKDQFSLSVMGHKYFMFVPTDYVQAVYARINPDKRRLLEHCVALIFY